MDSLGYITNSWGYGASLKSRQWILRYTPLIWGKWKSATKMWEWPHLASHCDEMA